MSYSLNRLPLAERRMRRDRSGIFTKIFFLHVSPRPSKKAGGISCQGPSKRSRRQFRAGYVESVGLGSRRRSRDDPKRLQFFRRFAETPPAARLNRVRSRKATGKRSSPVREPKWSHRARKGQEPAPGRQALLNRPGVQQSVVGGTCAIRCLGAAQATFAPVIDFSQPHNHESRCAKRGPPTHIALKTYPDLLCS